MGDNDGPAPAGWYDDGSGRKRWFDGAEWTDRYLDAPAPPPPPTPGTAYHPKMDAAAPGELQPKKDGNGVFLTCLGCAAVPVLIFAVVWVIGAVSGPKEYDANNRYEVIAQCEARIKDMLKSPSTAQFDTDATGSGTWTVTGTVDSENGFGAMVRSSFGCTVKVDGETITTSVNYLG
jgi:hypothetical protein